MWKNISKQLAKKIHYNPRKTTILVVLLLLIFIVSVQYLFNQSNQSLQSLQSIQSIPNKETFTIGTANRDYDPNKPLIVTDQRPLTFNQNYDKIWKRDAVSSNDNDRVPLISHSAVNYNPKQSEVINAVPAKQSHILTPAQITQTLKSLVKQHGLSQQEIKERYGAFYNTPYLSYGIGSANSKNKNFTTMNRQTWRSRWKDYKPSNARFRDFPIPVSPLEDMENMINFFLNAYNTTIHKEDFSKEMTKLYGFDKYFVSKYQLNDIHQNEKTNALVYGVTLILSQDVSSPISYTVYAQILRVTDYESNPDDPEPPSKYYIISADTVGNTTSDSLLIPPNVPTTEKHSYYSLHNDYNDSANKTPLTPKDVDTYLKNSIKRIKGRNISDQYVCFNSNVTDKDLRDGNQILYSSNARDCVSRYDLFGRPKQTGVWDRPCKSDEECPFYEANKNYTNDDPKSKKLGKCMSNGYCQLPINMEPIGYHYYDHNEKNKPLCYNCNTKEWNAITPLGKCCEEQEDRTKYPFLKSPDYAFKGDVVKRINENRHRNCHNKVDLNTGKTELVCKNT